MLRYQKLARPESTISVKFVRQARAEISETLVFTRAMSATLFVVRPESDEISDICVLYKDSIFSFLRP